MLLLKFCKQRWKLSKGKIQVIRLLTLLSYSWSHKLISFFFWLRYLHCFRKPEQDNKPTVWGPVECTDVCSLEKSCLVLYLLCKNQWMGWNVNISWEACSVRTGIFSVYLPVDSQHQGGQSFLTSSLLCIFQKTGKMFISSWVVLGGNHLRRAVLAEISLPSKGRALPLPPALWLCMLSGPVSSLGEWPVSPVSWTLCVGGLLTELKFQMLNPWVLRDHCNN